MSAVGGDRRVTMRKRIAKDYTTSIKIRQTMRFWNNLVKFVRVGL